MAITRERALELVRTHIKNENLVKHCLASEAVLKALARKLGEDVEAWGLAGLLHDLDVETTGGDLKKHVLETVRILAAEDVPPDIIEAIRLHNELAHGERRSKKFHHALAAGEQITGLITATALVYPDKKLKSVKVSSIVKRMKEARFAQTVNREIIRECVKIGLSLEEFASTALEAMQEISGDLGL